MLDEPIAIRTLKRFAAEHGTPAAGRRRPRSAASERVAIVGGGPAGMSAAYYLARLGYPVTVFEAMPVPGGMMAIGIPEYRLPREVLQAEIARIVGLGVELRLDTAMGRDFTLGDLEAEGFKAIFLATGASKSRRLGVPGDELRGVVPATRLPQAGQPRRGAAAVAARSSSSVAAARRWTRRGPPGGAAPTTVTIVYRRGRAEMPAQAEEIEAAEREGIVVRTGLAADRGRRSRRARSARSGMRTQAPTGAEPSGRAAWAAVPGSEAATAGRRRSSSRSARSPIRRSCPRAPGIEVSGWAGIVADPRTLATGRAGVFAGGDVVSGPKTIIDAVAAGRRAAGVDPRVPRGRPRRRGRDPRRPSATRRRPRRALTLDLEPRGRGPTPPLPIVDPGSFSRQPGRLRPRPTARAEAGRCFRCDAVYGCPTVAGHRRPRTGGRAGRAPQTATPSRVAGVRPADHASRSRR